ncbi:hypothetical protein DMH04_37105 [Kibdelosporangium aridum]|uniref:ABC-2 type transporter transmembrane domain-containing protein n=1 Tax=Kibdelosporangium aridum TaxID=2030 RepID=A0A428YYM8_KIBAR|nr:YhgE/Pip family protein [Kibdelosporangium aridum]RSM75929.1 hypothetical protein DMH04_37105 [Kibdelosporangium aridum]
MLKPFANSARAIASGPLTWKTWTGLIVVPVLIMGVLTWAFWSPGTDHGTATAAVVNNDEPVTVNGQIIPLGRELAGNLTHSSDSAYTWVLTDPADAAEGLTDGKYAAAVTIPQDFSARATSTATGKPLAATKAELRVQTSHATGVADPTISEQIARATQQTLNQQVVETYLDNVYVAFGTIHDQINQAADGAAQLADGTGQLKPGAQQVADGASRLNAAAGQLAAGSSQLSQGLSQAERDTAQLPALTRQLAAGAQQVAQGNEQLASAVVPLANRIIAAIDSMPSAENTAAQLRQLANECSEAAVCAELKQLAARFSTEASKIDSARNTVRAAAVQTRDSVQALAAGARQVANGNTQLAAKAGDLAGGISAAASGARKLSTGSRSLADGTGKLADGATQLRDGVNKVDSGAHELSSSLDKGRDQVPSYTPEERAHLKTVAANPTTAVSSDIRVGPLAIALFAALALWALALATYLVTRAVPAAVLTAREPTWRIIIRAALPGATAAVFAAVAITAIAAPVLQLTFARTLGFLGVALLAALAFVAINQAVTGIFGRPGRLASLAVLILAVATGIMSTLPSPLYDLSGYLPTHGAILALRAIATGTDGSVTGVVQLAVWLAVGTLATIVVTDRRRYLSARQLRPGTLLPAAT